MRWLLPFAMLVGSLGGCSSSSSPPTEDPVVAKPRPPTHATPEQDARAAKLLAGPDWYRHAVFYEVNVRSFTDTNGDGIGDLPGLTSRLDYLRGLGVDALWLMPIMPSPFKDSGYDISDYRGIDPAYGDMAAFDALLAAAHERGIRVVLDLVLNHTSSEHAWFKDSRSSKSAAKADWYVWSDTPGRADIGCGTVPGFEGSAWTFEPARSQYYFHRFYPGQPDLNYRNPEVVAETLDIARFWLDKGVDGFRCDVIGMLYESAAACEMIPETADYIRKLRAVLDEVPNRAMVAESSPFGATEYFGSGKDMFHLAFNFPFGFFWSAAFAAENSNLVVSALGNALASYPPGAQEASIIGSHDVLRAWDKDGGQEWRQRRAVEITMFTKATPFVYYGEELDLRGGKGVVVDWRDSARTPMPWTSAAGHGFSTAKPWLAFGDAAEQTNVEAEDADPDSMLSFYRSLLAFRRGNAAWGTSEMHLVALDNPALLAFVRRDGEHAYLVVESFSEDAQEGLGSASEVTAPGAVVWGAGQAVIEGSHVRVSVPATGSAVFELAN